MQMVRRILKELNLAADEGMLAPLGLLEVCEVTLSSVVEYIVALLVAAEIGILLVGLIARYLVHSPVIWSDELASILFIWLAMLGSAVALRRGEHMRMTAVVAKVGPSTRAFMEMLEVTFTLTFLVLVIPYGVEYMNDEAFVLTPALEISNSWRASALPTGCSLMLLFAVFRLFRYYKTFLLVAAVIVTALIAAMFYLVSPLLVSLGALNLVIFFIGVLGASVFLGVPIAFSFGIATFSYLVLTTNIPMTVMVGRMDEGMSHFILLSVPLFVFLGQLIVMTGMAKAMVNFLATLLGHTRGGMQYVLVGAMYLVAGISGSKVADMAAVAPALFPDMKLRGAEEGDLVALLSATGAQTETIPPSIVLITIGSVTGVSIGSLFIGGLLPSLVLAVTLCLMVWWRYRHEDLSHIEKATWGAVARAFVVALPAIALPFAIRAAVIDGIATATEVATIGVVYSTLAGLLIFRHFDWDRLVPMLVDTASLSGAILLIIGTATAMAWGLTQSGVSEHLAEAMTELPGGGSTFMAVSICAFIIFGSVLEGIPAIVLFGPLLFPIAKAVGIHEVHYAMVVILAMGIGLFMPPFGVGYYAACSIGRVNPAAGVRPIIGYMLALFAGLIVVAAIPWISIGFL